LLESARSTLRSHSAHSFKNSFKNLVSKSEAMIHSGMGAQLGGSHANLSTVSQVKSASKTKQARQSKPPIMDSNLLIDTNNVFDPVSVVYHHQVYTQPPAQQAVYAVGNIRNAYPPREPVGPYVAKPSPVYNSKPGYGMPYARSNSITQLVTCHKCAQPCSVQYVHQPPAMPPPPPANASNALYCTHAPAKIAAPSPSQPAHNFQNAQQQQQLLQQSQQYQPPKQLAKVSF
jgi:hypothetical protein